MELAATLMWRTHYVNLTPMYFNKAEGCYKYTIPALLLCGHYFINTLSPFSKKTKQLYYKWTTKVQLLYLYTRSATRGNVGLTFYSSSKSKDTFWNGTNYLESDSNLIVYSNCEDVFRQKPIVPPQDRLFTRPYKHLLLSFRHATCKILSVLSEQS